MIWLNFGWIFWVKRRIESDDQIIPDNPPKLFENTKSNQPIIYKTTPTAFETHTVTLKANGKSRDSRDSRDCFPSHVLR